MTKVRLTNEEINEIKKKMPKSDIKIIEDLQRMIKEKKEESLEYPRREREKRQRVIDFVETRLNEIIENMKRKGKI